MLAFTGGDERPQFLFGLQLRQTVQIEEQIRQVIATPQFFNSKWL